MSLQLWLSTSTSTGAEAGAVLGAGSLDESNPHPGATTTIAPTRRAARVPMIAKYRRGRHPVARPRLLLP
jgi:hypothetical protein